MKSFITASAWALARALAALGRFSLFILNRINNVSSTTALWQLLFLNPQCGFRKALKIHFQRIFKADTFLDVKLIPTYGRTKVQEKFDYSGIFLALLQPRTGFKLRYEACSRLMSRH